MWRLRPFAVSWRTLVAHAQPPVEELRRRGPVLVCCALGLSRSTAAAAAWLALSGRAAGPDEALASVARARPRLVLGREQRRRVAQAASAGAP